MLCVVVSSPELVRADKIIGIEIKLIIDRNEQTAKIMLNTPAGVAPFALSGIFGFNPFLTAETKRKHDIIQTRVNAIDNKTTKSTAIIIILRTETASALEDEDIAKELKIVKKRPKAIKQKNIPMQVNINDNNV